MMFPLLKNLVELKALRPSKDQAKLAFQKLLLLVIIEFEDSFMRATIEIFYIQTSIQGRACRVSSQLSTQLHQFPLISEAYQPQGILHRLHLEIRYRRLHSCNN